MRCVIQMSLCGKIEEILNEMKSKPPFPPAGEYSCRTSASETLAMHTTDSGAIFTCIILFYCFLGPACSPQTGSNESYSESYK